MPFQISSKRYPGVRVGLSLFLARPLTEARGEDVMLPEALSSCVAAILAPMPAPELADSGLTGSSRST